MYLQITFLVNVAKVLIYSYYLKNSQVTENYSWILIYSL